MRANRPSMGVSGMSRAPCQILTSTLIASLPGNSSVATAGNPPAGDGLFNQLDIVAASHAYRTDLTPIDPDDEGQADYSGPLLSDVDFAAFSHSALVRIADEVCLQMHLLMLSFTLAVRARANGDAALEESIRYKSLTGIAGVAAERIKNALNIPADAGGALRVLELHPLLNPAAYVSANVDPEYLHVRRSPAHDDGAWISLVSPAADRPVQAIVHAVDPHLRAELGGTDTDWTVRVVAAETASEEFSEVAVCKVSGGASWVFEDRKSLPLTVV